MSSSVNLDTLGAREALNSLADGAYITDLDRRIVFWNHSAERMTGWEAVDVVGRTCHDNILVHIDKDGHRLCGQEHCPLHRSIITGETSAKPILVFALRKDGARVPVEVSVSPVRAPDGRIVGGIEVFRDLTSLMDDMERARAIQAHTMESALPADPRLRFEYLYTPAEMVGGDFYRIERIADDLYAIGIADVMGHGLPAALYTMQLRSLWEDTRDLLNSPARFVGTLNRQLHRLARKDGYFATLCLLVLNAADGSLTYVRAGHPAPILLRSSGQAVPLGLGSPAVGLLPKAEFQEGREHLNPGDAFLLYTDGAIEILGAADHFLGIDGLVQVLHDSGFDRGDAGLKVVEERLLRVSGRIRLDDDLTLLAVRRTGLSMGA